ncbi:MAG TPA: hypothetical protein VLF67_05455, partial [Candidatus Saccharimonas sp.]|nr:hypothetical protein [Candidatus Saccharimonas sp.]
METTEVPAQAQSKTQRRAGVAAAIMFVLSFLMVGASLVVFSQTLNQHADPARLDVSTYLLQLGLVLLVASGVCFFRALGMRWWVAAIAAVCTLLLVALLAGGLDR